MSQDVKTPHPLVIKKLNIMSQQKDDPLELIDLPLAWQKRTRCLTETNFLFLFTLHKVQTGQKIRLAFYNGCL